MNEKNNRSLSQRRFEHGYNLIEMIVATAVLGIVVISVMSLFTMGRKNVYSGKEMTAAVSMATRAAEDLSGMSIAQVYDAFGIVGTDTTALSGAGFNVTVDAAGAKAGLPENTYTGSYIRRSSDTLVTTAGGNDNGQFLTRWKNEMDQNLKFAFGVVNIVITPRNPNPAAAALNTSNATVIRIRILVRWQEENRPRQLVVDTLKFNRPNPL
jgi:prepilin-type N-terminal cleavage/methylation domain-containing protein